LTDSDLHRRAIVVDGHCDTPYRILRRNFHLDEHDPEAQADLKTLREGGVTASFFAAYVPPYYANRGAAHFAHRVIDLIEAEVERNAKELRLCNDSAGIRAAKRDGRIAIMIGVEGGHAIEDSLITLRDLYRRGARYLTLTHWRNTEWADSATDIPREHGLTKQGEQLVRELNRAGIFVDIAHVSADVMRDVLRVSKAPIISSHSDAFALVPHPRNIPDDVLQALAKNGGVVHVAFIRDFVVDTRAREEKKTEALRSIRQRAATVIKLLADADEVIERDRDAARACIARASALLRDDVRPTQAPAGLVQGGLAPWQIARVRAHVETHLHSTIRMSDLTAIARLSTGHFSRSFTRSLGVAPFAYIAERRLARGGLDPLRHLAPGRVLRA